MVPTPVQSRHSGSYTNLILVLNNTGGKVLICAFILTIFLVVRAYTGPPVGNFFDWGLKTMVGIVVISFFGVVIKLSTSGDADWSSIFLGLFDFSFLTYLRKPIIRFSKELGNFVVFGNLKLLACNKMS